MSVEKEIMEFPKKEIYDCASAETFTSCKLPKGQPEWWKEVRKAPYQKFWDEGLPTQKLERFKYTNIAKAASQWDGVIGDHDGSLEGAKHYVSPLSDALKAEVDWIKDLVSSGAPGEDKYGDMALWNLNTAYLETGSVIDIPANTKVDMPISMALRGLDDTYTSLRLIVRVQKGAELTLIETHEGEGEYWKNHVTQIIVEDNAKLHHVRVQKDSDASVYTQNTHITLGRDSHYDGFCLNAGAGVCRDQIHAELQGANGVVSFNGVNTLKNKQHGDTTILIEHQAPHCESNQFYRSILDDKSVAVFQGKVHVHQIAQKTDGYQLSNALILSEQATMNTKPELEIYADDVKCSHGATTGQLEEEPLFYLRSRGLNEKQARYLLIQAFVQEVTEKIGHDDARDAIEKDIETWLQSVL